MKKTKKGTGSEGDKLPSKTPPAKKQLLPEKAGKYLREAGKIEDMPEPYHSKPKK